MYGSCDVVVAAVMTGANDIGCVGRARARGEQRLLTGALLCLQPHHDALDGKAQGDGNGRAGNQAHHMPGRTESNHAQAPG